jgi:hypothetical protein
MILFRDRNRRGSPPPWCDGAADLVSRSDSAGTLWAIGDPLLVGPQRSWIDIADGWDGCVLPPLDPAILVRRQLVETYEMAECKDLSGRRWFVPILLDESGRRAFRVQRGRDWLPALTPEQDRCLAIAHEIRDCSELPVEIACQYAAECISLANHVSPLVMAALGLMDDCLAIGSVIAVASRKDSAEVRNG